MDSDSDSDSDVEIQIAIDSDSDSDSDYEMEKRINDAVTKRRNRKPEYSEGSKIVPKTEQCLAKTPALEIDHHFRSVPYQKKKKKKDRKLWIVIQILTLTLKN
ncbi:hypothetical protein CCACVL1_12597 [Corchorus capsularis]|uniref:Uncharacterized protein n=1 Tax=Corchorus capsularis TaxID=210143 RepID=A0A1R3IEX6_COCAP|nr:hypothetical protein CCACVL1_12597 [Corchorus capsularis]